MSTFTPSCQPLGLVATISSFNFPLSRCGSSPSRSPPVATMWLHQTVGKTPRFLWLAPTVAEAALARRRFNVLQGDKTAVDELLINPKIKSVLPVGST